MSRIFLSPPETGAVELGAVREALESGWVAPAGPALGVFEARVSEWCGRAHAVAVTSGTAALHLALRVLGVQADDCVLCPTFTFAATLNPALYCGAAVELVDSCPRTWNMDPALLEARLVAAAAGEAAPVKAVIACSIYGNCAGLAEIEAICDRFGVVLLEDAAEALGARFGERRGGSFGRLAAVSFNGNKIITTSGGGMLLGNDRGLIEKARFLSSQAREPVRHYEHREMGYNYRMSNVLAALGTAQLEDLPRRIQTRRDVFERYRKAFAGSPDIEAMPVEGWGLPNFWLSCFLTSGLHVREAILDALEAADVEARPLWKPLHLQPAYAHLPVHGGGVAEGLFDRGIALPSGLGLANGGIERVIGLVRSALKSEV